MSTSEPRSTYLTTPPSPEDLARREQFKRKIERLEVCSDGWVDGFLKGEVSFRTMCVGVNRAAKHAGIEDRARETWLGNAVRRALDKPPIKEGRDNGQPSAFKRVAATLVDSVVEREGLARKPSRHEPSRGSAFAFVASIFHDAGALQVTERMVEAWYHESAKERDDVT